MYRVEKSKFTSQWLVINLSTKLAQSSWRSKADADRVCKDLNKGVKNAIKQAKRI